MWWRVERALLLMWVREICQPGLPIGVGAMQVTPLFTEESLQGLRGSAALASERSELGRSDRTIFIGGFLAGLITACILFGSYLMFKAQRAKGGDSTSESCTLNHIYGQLDAAAAQALDADAESIESLQCFWPRAGVLMVLMLIQSLSQVVLLHYTHLIDEHPSLVGFLTMLVGLGGNVGGQSLVLTVRRIAKGEDSPITEQLRTGLCLALLLSPLAFLRANLFGGVKIDMCITISVAVIIITISAAGLGTLLPKLFQLIRFDPGQAEPVLQCMMDVFGISVVCILGRFFDHVIYDPSKH